jgi:hypothetical protein
VAGFLSTGSAGDFLPVGWESLRKRPMATFRTRILFAVFTHENKSKGVRAFPAEDIDVTLLMD